MSPKNIPIILAAVLIVGLTMIEARFSDRWHDSSMDAEEFGDRFERVPMDVGPWKGEDQDVEEAVRKMAGAVHFVSRTYANENTDEVVRVWLIVGHSRDVCRHTPNVCYPSQGFNKTSSVLKQPIDLPGEKPAEFNTAKFEKSSEQGRVTERVFWAWSDPDEKQWKAPSNPRFEFGNKRALYKLYFTSDVKPTEETKEDNVALEFAKEMLPRIDAALFSEGGRAAEANETPAPSDSEQADSEKGEEGSMFDEVS